MEIDSKRVRIGFFLLRLLAFHNRLEGLMSFIAVWWGAWTIIFHDFWAAWPVTENLTERTYGHPYVLSYALLFSGLLGYWCRIRDWQSIRAICSITMFVSWGILTVTFLSIEPVFSPGVACYSSFMIGTLISYVSFQIGLELKAVREGMNV